MDFKGGALAQRFENQRAKAKVGPRASSGASASPKATLQTANFRHWRGEEANSQTERRGIRPNNNDRIAAGSRCARLIPRESTWGVTQGV